METLHPVYKYPFTEQRTRQIIDKGIVIREIPILSKTLFSILLGYFYYVLATTDEVVIKNMAPVHILLIPSAVVIIGREVG